MEKASPVTQKIVIGGGDVVVMFSDGVADSFASDQSIGDFIKQNFSPNPQSLADEILNQALANCNGRAVDDMTVLVVKIFNNQ